MSAGRPSEALRYGDIRQGFVYERVPHITLGAIANNAEIDVIWEDFQQTLEPLREGLNAGLGTAWEEWEIPRDADEDWPEDARQLHESWWQQRIARQQEIDASIADKADSEYLFDKPYEDSNKVRVAGPFTVESISPHRVLAVDENDEFIDTFGEQQAGYGSVTTSPPSSWKTLKPPASSRRTKRTASPSPPSTPGPATMSALRAATTRAARRTASSAAPLSSSVPSSAPSPAPIWSQPPARPPTAPSTS